MKIYNHPYGLPHDYDYSIINPVDYLLMRRTQVWIYKDTTPGSTQYGYGFKHPFDVWRYIASSGIITDFWSKRGMVRYIRKMFRYTAEMRRYRARKESSRFEEMLNLSGPQVLRAGLSNAKYRARWQALRSPLVVRFPENCLSTEEFTLWAAERDIVVDSIAYWNDDDTVVYAMVMDCPSPEIAFEAKMRWA